MAWSTCLRWWFLVFSSAGSPEWLASTSGSKLCRNYACDCGAVAGLQGTGAVKCSQGQGVLPTGENAKFSLSVFPRLDFLGWKTSSFYFTANISRKWHQSPSETALGHENNIREMFDQHLSYWNQQCLSKYSCTVSEAGSARQGLWFLLEWGWSIPVPGPAVNSV